MLIRMLKSQRVPDGNGQIQIFHGGQEYELPDEMAKELTGSFVAEAIQKDDIKNEPSPKARHGTNRRPSDRNGNKKLSKN